MNNVIFKSIVIMILTIFIMIINYSIAAPFVKYGPYHKFFQNVQSSSVLPPCLADIDDNLEGGLGVIKIPTLLPGRLSVGDLDGDLYADYVISSESGITAYNICGDILWSDNNVSVNWENKSHVYWNWSGYGIIGDPDGDGWPEFLHIGEDWKTLYIRNGRTGQIQREIQLPNRKWMYVLLAKRAGDSDDERTRIVVTGQPGSNHILAIDVRGGVKREFNHKSDNISNAYMPPVAVDLDNDGCDEIVHGTLALNCNGEQIMRFKMRESVLGAAHTVNYADFNPDVDGKELIYSVYGPNRGKFSVMSAFPKMTSFINWTNYSPFKDRHPHATIVGDFSSVKGNEGPEVIARGNGIDHWLIGGDGVTLNSNIRLSELPENWREGECLATIDINGDGLDETLYTERHMNFRDVPRLLVVSHERPTTKLFGPVHGGINVPRTDTDPKLGNKPQANSWFGNVQRNPPHNDDGPYECNSQVGRVLFGTCDDIVAQYPGGIAVYYNPEKQCKIVNKVIQHARLGVNVYNPVRLFH